MRWLILLCCIVTSSVAQSAGFKILRRPCGHFKIGVFGKSYNGYPPCDEGYNAHSVNIAAPMGSYINSHYSSHTGSHYNPHATQTDGNRLIQIVNNNNIQNQQQAAVIPHQPGVQTLYASEPIYNSYPAVGHNVQHFGNSGAVASSASSASSSSWNQQNGNLAYPHGHMPAGGVAHSSASSWSASSSG